ncbi:MAG: NADH-quinone oxidoreductase subunit N [Stygiobacter sp.]|uniref:NADH-quinone oxidoreductase subunit N n=1 Tax=Stygiobacter electus TaxID=3032292 RepID=A0AAE3TF85_9BACT|nr:NADH-quinone oxidoreductase subunit N [Stygiobacter electus]MDF1613202.1 NADH-quinone oxidoreductase subunit N [Stygiobacter electus]
MANLYQSLELIRPEIVLSIALIVLVIFDLIFHVDKKIIPYVALVGLIATGIFTLLNPQSGFAFQQTNLMGKIGIFAVDSFGNYFKILIIISSILIVLYSFSSEEINKIQERIGEYYALIFGMILGMFFIVSATDLILVYLSLELMSLSSYVLAGFTKLRDRNSEASLKYLIYGAVSSGLMLYGISLIYGLTGSTNFYIVNMILQIPNANQFTLAFANVLIFAGIGYKISSVPFHFWTPDVYEGAPITITTYLSVASKAAGFALLIRFIKTTFVSFSDSFGNWQVISSFDWKTLLIIISILTMTLGNFTALWQNNLKRLLAFSSIAHAGYLLLGVVVFSNGGVLAILIYFFVYLLMNYGAFLIVMLISNKSGSENIDDYDGLGYTSPLLAVSFVIFLVSLAGLPPTAGFIGKLYIFIALVDAKMITVAIIALLNTVVSLYYYVRIVKHMYLNKPTENTLTVKPNLGNTILTLVLVIPVLVFGIYFQPLVDWAKNSLNILGLM